MYNFHSGCLNCDSLRLRIHRLNKAIESAIAQHAVDIRRANKALASALRVPKRQEQIIRELLAGTRLTFFGLKQIAANDSTI